MSTESKIELMKIFGADGKLTTVTERIDYHDQLQYNVEFEDGRRVECGEGHLWTLINNKGKKHTLELKDFKDNYKIEYQNGRVDNRYFNTFCNPIEFNHKELPIDPYYLGLWLGDGKKTSPMVTTPDEEIKSYIYKYAEELQLDVSNPGNLILNNYSKSQLYNLGTNLSDGTVVMLTGTGYNKPVYIFSNVWYTFTGTSVTLP